jgi:SpoVK/Ycf46/Vps4 family AAA+-type ATPase
MIVDLPDQSARKKILETHLKDESLDDSIDLDEFAKITAQYSGSDLKNICVAAALSRVKETVVIENGMNGLNESEMKEKIESIEDWGSFLSMNAEKLTDKSVSPLKLSKRHLHVGLSECPPSLTDETQTLIELRKWDNQYGDGAAKRRKRPNGYGFAIN